MKRSLLLFWAAISLLMLSCGPSASSDPDAIGRPSNVSGVSQCAHTPIKKDGKRVLVVSGSPRRGGNTDLLADAFAKGASEAGGNVDKIFLADSALEFLSSQGANHPQSVSRNTPTGRIVEKFLAADVVVLASPVYYMNVSDRMKTFIDATYLGLGDSRMAGKEYYYLTAFAERDTNTAEWIYNAFRGFIMWLPESVERGHVGAAGMGAAGAVKGSDYERQAYLLGKTIND